MPRGGGDGQKPRFSLTVASQSSAMMDLLHRKSACQPAGYKVSQHSERWTHIIMSQLSYSMDSAQLVSDRFVDPRQCVLAALPQEFTLLTIYKTVFSHRPHSLRVQFISQDENLLSKIWKPFESGDPCCCCVRKTTRETVITYQSHQSHWVWMLKHQ